MMANAARNAFKKTGKYLPPELALAQLAVEGGLSKDRHAKPIRTNNPFDVGNTETGTHAFPTVADAVNAYYDLITRNYLGKGKSAVDLVSNFVDKNNQRYAVERDYESAVNKIALDANKIAQQVSV